MNVKIRIHTSTMNGDQHNTSIAIRYVDSVGNMNTDDLTDMLDGTNSYDLTRRLTIIGANRPDLLEMCNELISFNTYVYNNRYRAEEWILSSDLQKLRQGCRAVADMAKTSN
jgi:hypothetical protein